MAKLIFILFLLLLSENSADAQSISQDLFYPNGSVPKRFGLYVNDTLRSSVQFGDSRFETLESETKIEIMKLIFNNNKIMLLDEPTAVLTPQETNQLKISLEDEFGNLIDLNGNEVFRNEINSSSKIDLTQIQSGVYFINVYEDNSIVGRKKIVIQH